MYATIREQALHANVVTPRIYAAVDEEPQFTATVTDRRLYSVVTTIQLYVTVGPPSGLPRLFPGDLHHVHTLSEALILPTVELDPSDLIHQHTIDSTSIGEFVFVDPEDLEHAHVLDATTLTFTPATGLVPADLNHAHDIDPTALVFNANLSPEYIRHPHTIDSTSFTGSVPIDASDLEHAHTLDPSAITVSYSLPPADLSHAHTIDATQVTVGYAIVPQDLIHTHNIDSTSIVVRYASVPEDLGHVHTVDETTLSFTPGVVAIDPLDLGHGHTIDEATITFTPGAIEPSPPLQTNDSYNKLFSRTTTGRPKIPQLAGFWKLDETSGDTLFDSSGEGLHLVRDEGSADIVGQTPSGSPPAWVQRVVKFDGNSRYRATMSSGAQQTLGAWFYQNADIGTSTLISLYDASQSLYRAMLESTSAGRMRYYYGSANAGTTVNLQGNWRLMIGTQSANADRRLDIYDPVSGEWNAVNTTYQSLRFLNRVAIGGQARDLAQNFSGAEQAEAFWFAQKTLTPEERQECVNGPEPLRDTGGDRPTLSFGATDWTGTTGDWDSQSNGTLTYDWELREHPSNLMIQSGAGVPSGSNPDPGQYYLAIRAYNNGGYDAEEQQYSLVQTV